MRLDKDIASNIYDGGMIVSNKANDKIEELVDKVDVIEERETDSIVSNIVSWVAIGCVVSLVLSALI